MSDSEETGALHANIHGRSGVSNWASKMYIVDGKVFLSTEDGDVAIEAVDEGRLRVGPREELEED